MPENKVAEAGPMERWVRANAYLRENDGLLIRAREQDSIRADLERQLNVGIRVHLKECPAKEACPWIVASRAALARAKGEA